MAYKYFVEITDYSQLCVKKPEFSSTDQILPFSLQELEIVFLFPYQNPNVFSRNSLLQTKQE